LWGISKLEVLEKKNKSETQKEAETGCEHRPLASAAMLAHFKEVFKKKKFSLVIVMDAAMCRIGVYSIEGWPRSGLPAIAGVGGRTFY
jgi:hypothetical protein